MHSYDGATAATAMHSYGAATAAAATAAAAMHSYAAATAAAAMHSYAAATAAAAMHSYGSAADATTQLCGIFCVYPCLLSPAAASHSIKKHQPAQSLAYKSTTCTSTPVISDQRFPPCDC